jgi:hypothetical protein
MAMKIEHGEPCFVQDMKTASADGSILFGRSATYTTGQEFSNDLRGLAMNSTATWTGVELVIESRVHAAGKRPARFRDYWSLAHDGSELRMEHCDHDIAGQLTVLERVTETHGA